jgi:hypothetical protein
VHLVEPQWNPSVEEQAVARAVRIGQTRPVTVMRYIVKRTVEEVRNELTNFDDNGADPTFRTSSVCNDGKVI